jgi:drug/metabolite transporter (DMT)-like permease
MVLEPVWAGIFTFLLLGRRPDLRTMAGALMVLAAMLLAVRRSRSPGGVTPAAGCGPGGSLAA